MANAGENLHVSVSILSRRGSSPADEPEFVVIAPCRWQTGRPASIMVTRAGRVIRWGVNLNCIDISAETRRRRERNSNTSTSIGTKCYVATNTESSLLLWRLASRPVKIFWTTTTLVLAKIQKPADVEFATDSVSPKKEFPITSEHGVTTRSIIAL